MKLGVVVVIAISSSATAAPTLRTIAKDGEAPYFGFVGQLDPQGRIHARQVIPAAATSTQSATSRTLYLNRGDVILFPGDNDSVQQTSSLVPEAVEVPGWYIDDDTWAATVQCVADMYSRFDVTVTDEDPGNTPHIEALIGGNPGDIGLPDNVAGVSPFTEDCGIIESSIVFTFADALPADAQTICEIASQELAHSFGLDHEMLPQDPMTYLDYDGDRAFQDDEASCGEYDARPCGINGSVCRPTQSSVKLLQQRVGKPDDGSGAPKPPTRDSSVGCSTTGGGGLAAAIVLIGLRRRRLRA